VRCVTPGSVAVRARRQHFHRRWGMRVSENTKQRLESIFTMSSNRTYLLIDRRRRQWHECFSGFWQVYSVICVNIWCAKSDWVGIYFWWQIGWIQFIVNELETNFNSLHDSIIEYYPFQVVSLFIAACCTLFAILIFSFAQFYQHVVAQPRRTSIPRTI
jgi:hypothetical protein